MIKSAIIGFFVILSFSPTCTRVQKVPDDEKKCIQSLIEKLEAAPPQTPTAAIWQYVYQGNSVFLVPAACCDQFNPVYDVDCKVLCHPDGGITGKGDMQCTDFYNTATDKELVWKDTRSVE